MNIKLYVTVISILFLCGSVTLGITPMGSPTVNLEKGQWSIGFDYSNTEVDLKLTNMQGHSFFTRSKLNDVEIDNYAGKLTHGINDNWEVFASFGVAKAEYKETVSWVEGGFLESVLIDYESDTGFASTVGTKATFYEKGPLGLGALFQVNWVTLDGTYTEATWTDGVFNDTGEGDLDADIMVLKFAPGASYQFDDNITLYGGPLWQWIDGDGSADGQTGALSGEGGKGDIEQDSSFGGWIGLHTNTDSNTTVNIEYQLTGSSETFGFSIAKRF